MTLLLLHPTIQRFSDSTIQRLNRQTIKPSNHQTFPEAAS